ncbi:sensor histidine kinase [Kitasatospora terrestris]|uniref:Histidine kinase n=1 Tax=Kitasatospora terrestris TaxID=258051 RepID=A0ABP9DQY3_9ACTN
MDVAMPVRRWRATGKPQRTELYVRWSLYAVSLVQPLATLGMLGGAARNEADPAVLRIAAVGTVVAAALNAALFKVALPAYLGRRPRPTGWLVVSGLITYGIAFAVLLLAPALDRQGQPSFGVGIAVITTTFWVAAASLALRIREAAVVGVAAIALTGVPLVLAGLPGSSTAGALTGAAIGALAAATTCRCSAWTAAVVWELDSAREAQARLAVAEERLRFSRDLHDVLGRNLTTMALKSELAVQLSKRGRPEAVDQMTEVQRIAQESHREVRELVRGYREADLPAEVAGARSVLRAADVECETDFAMEPGTLPPRVQSVLGWVVREATTNVLRHSEAGHCAIRLRVRGGAAVLEVENDGVPLVPSPRPADGAGGHGLSGLRERLAPHGGVLDLPAVAAGSFRLTATLPLTDPAPEAPTR